MTQTDISTKKDAPKAPPKKNLRYLRDKDAEKVRGIFKFYEVPGGTMSFTAKAYKEDQPKRYDLVDGQVYEIPLGIAKHLNKNCWYPVHSFSQNESGTATQRIGQKVHRCGFQSLEFVDVEDMETSPAQQIVTVENI